MSYIDDIAIAIRRHLPAGLLPDADVSELFRIYAVLALAKGDSVELEDVHDAWSAWMSGHQPNHRSLRPFSALPQSVRVSDEPYLAAIRVVARDLRLGR